MPEENNIERTFTQALGNVQHLPNGVITEAFNTKVFPLMDNAVFSHKTGDMAAEEYKRCLSLLERRAPNEYALPDTMRACVMTTMRLQPVMNTIALKEMKIKEELEKIAVDTIRELFDIPEDIELIPKLEAGVDMDTEQDDSGEGLTEEEKLEMEDEIQKRIILNGLVHGSSIHIWKSAHYIVKDQIDELDDMLMMLYNDYTAAVSWLLWQTPPQMINADAFQQGFNEIDFDQDGDGVTIECSGINFPVLLHEVTKGAMDYLICHGIPEDYTKEQLKYYYAVADNYNDEIWHYLLGPTVWNKFISAAGVDTQELPKLIAKLAKLECSELTEILQACIDNPEAGQVKLNEL